MAKDLNVFDKDHSVELPLPDGGLENRPRARRRLYHRYPPVFQHFAEPIVVRPKNQPLAA